MVFLVWKVCRGMQGRGGDRDVVLVSIYLPYDLVGKRRLWDELKVIKEDSNVTRWHVMGDFNCIRKRGDKSLG